jgi:murein DD-endopeptidase MepM/ murein hydrolase activator NlpD
MDLAVPTGTPIRAALGGTVTVSKYNAGGYGYYVMIDHGNGLATLYGHCSKLLAKVGQTVEAGDIIALSGSTGRSTGPHLHFETRVNGERTNPRAYLPKG